MEDSLGFFVARITLGEGDGSHGLYSLAIPKVSHHPCSLAKFGSGCFSLQSVGVHTYVQRASTSQICGSQ
jgi:hypothetical protein